MGFDPWALRLSVDDIAIAAAAGAKPAEPQLRVAHLRVDFDARSLLRLAPVVEALQIDAPRLRIARTAAGRYDIDDVLQRLAPNPDAAPRGTPRFALFNVELRDGEFLFDDRPVQREHELTALTLSLPFVSSLPSQVDVKVEPRLSFTLNGAAYDSGAQAVPFASSRSGALTLRVASLDLAPYVDYFPETLPVRVRRGRVNGDLTLDFAAPEHAEPRVSLRGAIGAGELSLTEQGGAPLLDIEKLALTLTDVQPLARKVVLGALRLDGPELHLARDASGVLNLARLTNPKTSATAATAAPDEAAPAATAWQLSLESCDVAGARLLWNDAAVQPAAAFVLGDMTLSSRQLRLPFVAPAPFSLAATLKPQGSVTATLAKLALQGQASDTAAAVEVSISDLSLAALAPYFNASTHAQVAGTGAVHAKAGMGRSHAGASIARRGDDRRSRSRRAEVEPAVGRKGRPERRPGCRATGAGRGRRSRSRQREGRRCVAASCSAPNCTSTAPPKGPGTYRA